MNDLTNAKVTTDFGDWQLYSGHAVEGFDEENEEWRLYVERKYYITPMRFKKCAIFVSTIGLRAYKLLDSLVVAVSPGVMKYKQVVERMAQHYCPKPSVIV